MDGASFFPAKELAETVPWSFDAGRRESVFMAHQIRKASTFFWERMFIACNDDLRNVLTLGLVARQMLRRSTIDDQGKFSSGRQGKIHWHGSVVPTRVNNEANEPVKRQTMARFLVASPSRVATFFRL